MINTFIDFFCGIGGFHLSVKNVFTESECKFAVDIDKYAAQTYQTNFNLDPLNDITTLNLYDLPSVDLVCGGFPCQPFSRNGKYFNLTNQTIPVEEKRANLFFYVLEYARIHGPRFLLLENVKGLLSMKDSTGKYYYETIVESFETLGYYVKFKVLNSADYGVAQQRKRVYFICFREEEDYKNFEFPEPLETFYVVEDIKDSNANSKSFLLKTLWGDLKNKKLAGTRYEQLVDMYRGYDGGRTKKIIPVSIIYGDTPSGGPRQQDKLYSCKGISPTIATFALSIPAFDFSDGWRKLTPRECARLQGFPDDFTLHPSNNQAYKQIGNAVTVNTVTSILKSIKNVFN